MVCNIYELPDLALAHIAIALIILIKKLQMDLLPLDFHLSISTAIEVIIASACHGL